MAEYLYIEYRERDKDIDTESGRETEREREWLNQERQSIDWRILSENRYAYIS